MAGDDPTRTKSPPGCRSSASDCPERDRQAPAAALSHASAAGIWELGTIIPGLPVLTVRRWARGGRGIKLHRLALEPDDRQWWRPDGGPRVAVTTPARTIVDLLLAGEEPSHVERAVQEAGSLGLAGPEDLAAAARRRRRRHAGLVADLDRLAPTG